MRGSGRAFEGNEVGMMIQEKREYRLLRTTRDRCHATLASIGDIAHRTRLRRSGCTTGWATTIKRFYLSRGESVPSHRVMMSIHTYVESCHPDASRTISDS